MYSGQEITTGHWKFSDHFKWMSEDFELIHIYSVLHGWSRFSNVYANLKPYFLLWGFTTSKISEDTCIQRIKKLTSNASTSSMESGLNTASAVTAIPFISPWSYTRYLVIDRDVILEALTPKLFRNYMKENKNTDELYIIH